MQIEKPKLAFKGKLTPIKKVTKVVCHHPAHPTWGIMEIHNYHKNSKGWAGIGYNYLICKDGRIQEGRGKNVGAHCSGRNSDTLGVCFQGDFDKQQMTDAQVKAGGWLIAKLIKEHGLQINDVLGHRDLAATACPGKNFRMADLKAEILANLNPKTKTPERKLSGMKPNWKDWQWKEAAEIYKKARVKGILSSDEWEKKAAAKNLTFDEIEYLNLVLNGRLL
ncbi:holin family protein [Bacillus phage vB_Bacillus_1020A]|uniref:peptidoglycan recognition protein family protein n=1 Tax=Robertmurraya sp. DFI.2.37 TaxID=3031819 RepID=UPI001248A7B4|nr:peptidoglycan recognition family protein [Robertmurraya sp. DFI.2.37]MDF1510837.1 peptidoglycan recognition family protein [Robertmurraya sp. DFI.2.37]QIW89318.1 holin family protein [Bacillus phage vB_Bacillus_1020A]